MTNLLDQIKTAYLASLELNANAEARIRSEFAARIENNEQAISSLKEKADRATNEAKEVKSTLTYVPKLGSGSKSLPEDMKSGIDGVTGVGNYKDFRDSVIREGRRLLYVAVTRARDIFVEVGQHAKENKMITETMKDLYADPKWKSQTGKDWDNGTCQQIWGPGTPLFYYREMAIDPAQCDC